MEIMLLKNLSSCYSRGAFLLGEVDNLESPQSPFSFAKMFNVLKWFGENETAAEKYTLRERNLHARMVNQNNQNHNGNRNQFTTDSSGDNTQNI